MIIKRTDSGKSTRSLSPRKTELNNTVKETTVHKLKGVEFSYLSE